MPRLTSIIREPWEERDGARFSKVLDASVHPQGVDIVRVWLPRDSVLTLGRGRGHIMSVLGGAGTVRTHSLGELTLVRGSHIYLPSGEAEAFCPLGADVSLVLVSAEDVTCQQGRSLIVRDEEFLGVARARTSLRRQLTSQYLSQRIFLHHDRTLVSPRSEPLSWFSTTMFACDGLPENEEGDPVFRMSYNHRTEINVCFRVRGQASVRTAIHPYVDSGQRWSPWLPIDDETSYHLYETAATVPGERRNKHEIRITGGGYVSLFCMFCPAPTGIETHDPGKYSDYGVLSETLRMPAYAPYRDMVAEADELIDRLSTLKAQRGRDAATCSPEWKEFEKGYAEQTRIEGQLIAAHPERAFVLRPFLLPRLLS